MGTEKTVDIIIQARMGSTRLPGKILLPIGGRTILECIVEAAGRSKYARNVIVATSVSSGDDIIEEKCKKIRYLCFRGSELDVLARYYWAAKKFGSDIVVRLTADNIFTDIDEMERLIDILLREELDYADNHRGGVIPLGMGSEAFTFSALTRAHKEAEVAYEREHVTPYFYEHPDFFRQQEVVPQKAYAVDNKARFTLDTIEDYEFLKTIYKAISKRGRIVTSDEAIEFLSENESISRINRQVKQKIFNDI